MKHQYQIKHIVADNLRSLRNRKQISQLDLSVQTGLSLTFINNIENGKKWVSAETISTLCSVLDAYPFEFFLTNDIPDQNSAYQIIKDQEQILTELDEVLSRYNRKGESS